MITNTTNNCAPGKAMKTAISVIIVTMILLFSCSKIPHYELSRFISAETCGGCHDEIYSQWKTSMHAYSHSDSLYREVALRDLKVLTDKDELKEAELCVKCHTPVGYVSGMPTKTSDHAKKIPKLAEEGIQCDFCHSLTGARKLYNAELDMEPGHGEQNPGVKRGPLRDAKSDFHGTAYSRFHTEPGICAACHDVRHVVFGTRLETPYEEWMNGPYGKRGSKDYITCQGCHMYQKPGLPATGSTERPPNPGKASSDGPERQHVFTHYFVGGNTLVPSMKGRAPQSQMAEERLKNAAQISINPEISERTLSISVTNNGAGHKIPTGLSHVRQVWIELTVKSPSGAVLYRSGVLDNAGTISENGRIYCTVFGDGKGKKIMNVARAREILNDSRIPPKGTVVEKYTMPESVKGTIIVEARLLYRLAPQDLVDAAVGKGTIRIPVIEMAKDAKRITI